MPCVAVGISLEAQMKNFAAVVVIAVSGLWVACGPVDSNEVGDGEVTVSTDAQEQSLAQAPELSPEMLQALAVACQPSVSCAGYSSCGSWSGTYRCGEPNSCNFTGCRVNVCEGSRCYFEYRGVQSQGQNRYRVCHNPAGESCTEWERTNTSFCGCAES